MLDKLSVAFLIRLSIHSCFLESKTGLVNTKSL